MFPEHDQVLDHMRAVRQGDLLLQSDPQVRDQADGAAGPRQKQDKYCLSRDLVQKKGKVPDRTGPITWARASLIGGLVLWFGLEAAKDVIAVSLLTPEVHAEQ